MRFTARRLRGVGSRNLTSLTRHLSFIGRTRNNYVCTHSCTYVIGEYQCGGHLRSRSEALQNWSPLVEGGSPIDWNSIDSRPRGGFFLPASRRAGHPPI